MDVPVKKWHGVNNIYHRLHPAPAQASFLFTLCAFAFFLFFLHPGYGIIDDIKMIGIVTGYPGGTPVPFMVHSNVLLGFLFRGLYSLPTALNWAILFFIVINFLSVWAVLYILWKTTPIDRRLIGILIVLSYNTYIVLNITFTAIASFACLAGICLLLSGASLSTIRNREVFSGLALIVISSLIRIELTILVLGVVLPSLGLMKQFLNSRNLFLALSITGLCIFGGYAFDRLYVRSFPDWNFFYSYNRVRGLIHDTHRLENVHQKIKRIGWSGNDQELFARWFYPNPDIYSLDHLQYLVDHVPGIRLDLAGTITDLLEGLIRPGPIPYLIVLPSTCLWALGRRCSRKTILLLLVSWVLCLGENLFLAWAYKAPERILIPSLINTGIWGWVALNWFETRDSSQVLVSAKERGVSQMDEFISMVSLALAFSTILYRSLQTSNNNAEKQNIYQRVLADFQMLKTEGKIPGDALIISSGHGLPLEWSNPLILQYPDIDYLDTGWITFSPPYEQVLRKHSIESLPDALYQKSNIYLMAESSFTVFLARYYQEHGSIAVTFQSIYTLPDNRSFSDYVDVHLYKVTKSNQ